MSEIRNNEWTIVSVLYANAHLMQQIMPRRHETSLDKIPTCSLAAGKQFSHTRLVECLFHPGGASLRALSQLSYILPLLKASCCVYIHVVETLRLVSRRPSSLTSATRIASEACHYHSREFFRWSESPVVTQLLLVPTLSTDAAASLKFSGTRVPSSSSVEWGSLRNFSGLKAIVLHQPGAASSSVLI